jgi:hypothetical protein
MRRVIEKRSRIIQLAHLYLLKMQKWYLCLFASNFGIDFILRAFSCQDGDSNRKNGKENKGSSISSSGGNEKKSKDSHISSHYYLVKATIDQNSCR